MKFSQRFIIARGFPLYILIIVPCITGMYSELRIEYIKSTKAPRVEEKKLMYILDVGFNERPQNYWSYFDKTENRIVIDCYDTRLGSLPANIQVSRPFIDFEINNTEVRKTVTGKLAKFSIALDSLWYYKIDPVDNTALRVTVWKELKEPQKKQEKKSSTFGYFAIAGLTGALTFAIILLTTQQ
ncbi:MAG: hypothetical protein GF350_12590 [Chitinivibrionales bacterium]|nr:hypothetical protein [Chitinivibrionales bacterium]